MPIYLSQSISRALNVQCSQYVFPDHPLQMARLNRMHIADMCHKPHTLHEQRMHGNWNTDLLACLTYSCFFAVSSEVP